MAKYISMQGKRVNKNTTLVFARTDTGAPPPVKFQHDLRFCIGF